MAVRELERTIAAGKPLVLITWHGRMIVPVWFMRGRGIVAMISRHSDGEMVSRLVEKLGYGTIRGSSTRGGTAATLEMLDTIHVRQDRRHDLRRPARSDL